MTNLCLLAKNYYRKILIIQELLSIRIIIICRIYDHKPHPAFLFFSLLLLLIQVFIFLRIKYLFSVYIAFSSTQVNFKENIFDKLNIFPMQHISTTINETQGQVEVHLRYVI